VGFLLKEIKEGFSDGFSVHYRTEKIGILM